ncbi:MAG: tetratricopeptide repeat protein [Chloroflexi bacterium]|nr:tetratricopeptide repeat protein [Chloroflexota bacterium]
MPGNRSIYKEAIKKGHNFAWDGQWAKAIAEYRRALAEFQDDMDAHLSLAHALDGAGQYESALHECRVAYKLEPLDPVSLTLAAALQEKLHRTREATNCYLSLAELYTNQRAPGKAVEAWQKAAALEPDRIDVHQKLAAVFEQGEQHALAAKEFVSLAQIYIKGSDRPKAREMVHRALAFDPQNTTAQSLLSELDRGQAATQEVVPGPVDQAQQDALSRLAETLLEERPNWVRPGSPDVNTPESSFSLSQSDIDRLIARAVDAQTQHHLSDAIECYRQVLDAGVGRPEVKLNLGLLYLETMHYEDAIKLLNETANDPNYQMASHFALGQCYRAQGNLDAAMEQFIQVTKIVDLGSVRRDQADELISVYEGLTESYAAKGDREQAEAFSRSLEELLTSKGWEDKVRQVRRHLEELREEEGQVSLAEIIQVPESDKVLEALALSREYVRRGKNLAAAEECFRAIEFAPGYFPPHVRLAEILIKEKRIEEAKAKYETLAELAIARGELARGERFYRRLLKIAADDVENRIKLIDVLVRQDRTEAALAEYLELGDAYARSGQNDKAAEKFGEGLRLADRAALTNSAALKLRYRLAETRAANGDLKGALVAYQEIAQHSPEDEEARLRLVELEYRLGQTAAAVRDLGEMLERYRARKELVKAIPVLEGLVSEHPNDLALRSHLAQCYNEVNETGKALAALDALGEMQLTAGQKREAAATIRQIISLNPPRVEDYRKLLKQIGE